MSANENSAPLKQWQFQNRVVELTACEEDNHYKYDDAAVRKELDAKRWTQDPNYFQSVRISATALLKMVMHARSGGNIEVMGLMYGKIQGREMIVLDAFELPVEGTETRVNAQAEGYEYMVAHTTKSKLIGRKENVIGWYHSHPGYGCWLSGIDVSTQMLNQQYQEPFLAIVIDPHRTMAAGKVEIGAFRTLPKPANGTSAAPSNRGGDGGGDSFQAIPMDKIEDFGVHANQYYSLSISYFKSSLDEALLGKLWNRYWVNTLSSSTILTNHSHTCRQIQDLASKLEKANVLPASQSAAKKKAGSDSDGDKKEESAPATLTPLQRLAQRSQHICDEVQHALMHETVKRALFGKLN